MGEWLENLIKLLAAIYYHFTYIFIFYYSKPYWFVIDWCIPLLCFIYLKYKYRFYFQDGIGATIFRSLIYSFFGATLGVWCLLVVFGIIWHTVAFFIRIFVSFDKYYVPRLIWDLYKDKGFYLFPILIFVCNMLSIKYDFEDFDKVYAIYKKRRKK